MAKTHSKNTRKDKVPDAATAPGMSALATDEDEFTAVAPPPTAPSFKDKVSAAVVHQKKQHDALPFTFTFPDGITLRTDKDLNSGQRCTLEELGEWFNDPTEHFYTLKGYAGTGKTTIMRLFVQYMQRVQSRRFQEKVGQGENFFGSGGGDILLAAPTHRARQVLYQLAGQEIPRENCHTIHSLLALRPDFEVDELDVRNLSFAQGEGKQSKLLARSTLLIDEVSMMSDGLVHVLQDQALKLHVKICFIGDPAQIKPVKQDKLSAAFDVARQSELTQVMRQADGNPISYLLETIRKSQHLISDQFERYDRLSAKGEGIMFISNTQLAKTWVMEKLLSEEFEADPNFVRVLCATNKRVALFNQSLRNVRWGSDAAEYMVGELLTGYANYGNDPNSYDFSPLITNSADYLVVAAYETSRRIMVGPENEMVAMEVPGWQLTLVDTDSDAPPSRRYRRSVFIVSRNCGGEVLHALSRHLQNLQFRARNAKGPAKKLAWNKFFAFQESFCLSVDYMEGNYTRIKRTLNYGYALTVHKSQGGTYNYVLVDEADIDAGFPREHQLRHQLKYVALSRASKQVLCLTSQPIIEPSFEF